MCGITAVSRADRSSISNINLFMRLASYTIEKRGPHATGFAWLNRNNEGWYQKSPGKATEVAHKFDLSGARVAIGHTRFATQGKPEDNENNHPLIEDSIMLVHNGIMDNDDWVFKHLTGIERTNEVDSQAIACLLAYPEEFGAKGPAEVLEDNFEGDAALAWLDSDTPGMLHLARCLGRPMHIGTTRKGDLVMASEEDNLVMLARMSGVDIGDIWTVQEGTYLQVVKGEIVHQENFAPYISYRHYTKSHKSTTTTTKPAVIGSAKKEPTITEPREEVQKHTYDWDTSDDRDFMVKEALARSGGDWSFLDWEDDEWEYELFVQWGIDRSICADDTTWESTLKAFKDDLEAQAEREDYLAIREFFDETDDGLEIIGDKEPEEAAT